MSNMSITEHRPDYEGSRLGMWIFLFTEMLLFAGLFLLYSVFRTRYSPEFHTSSVELSRTAGTVNTIILLTSSLTMALSISVIKSGRRGMSLLFQSLTVSLGILFLVNKYFEWGAKLWHGIYPNSPELLQRGKGKTMFYGLYYLMTGLHGLHVLAGVILLTIMFIMTVNNRINREQYVRLENSGLYWHLVDVVWVYLFPVFYLIN